MPCMMELRIRTCHVRGSFECRDNMRARHLDARADGRAGRLRLHAARAPARHLPAREAQGRGAHCRPRARYIAEHKLNELIRGGATPTWASWCRAALQRAGPQPAAARPGRCLRRRPTSRCWCSTSPTRWCRSKSPTSALASARCWWWRKASPNTSSRRSPRRCAARDIQTPLHGKDMLPAGGRVRRGGAGRAAWHRWPRATSPRAHRAGFGEGLMAAQPRPPRRRGAAGWRRRCRDPPAELLHRLPRAPGVLGAEAGAAGQRPGAHRGRHRLPCLRHLRALLDGPLDPRLRHEPGQPRGRRRR